METLFHHGFPLAKWTTNHAELAKTFGQHLNQEVELESEPGVLGISWVPSSDRLRLRLNKYPTTFKDRHTKADIVSRIARLYDPTGLFAPFTIVGKIIVQDIWKHKI